MTTGERNTVWLAVTVTSLHVLLTLGIWVAMGRH